MNKIFTVDLEVESLRDEIYKRIDLIYDAICDAQSVWMRMVAKAEVNRTSMDERTNYELRIGFSGPSFVVKWYSFQFVRHGNKQTRVMKALAVPESGKYTQSQFKRAQAWELDLINSIEESISPYRVQLKHLMKMHQTMLHLGKTSNRPVTAIPINERVTKPSYSISDYKNRYRR